MHMMKKLSDPGLEMRVLSPCWVQFIRFCEKMGFGEIEKLKIQNGVPMMAEQVTKKIKFS